MINLITLMSVMNSSLMIGILIAHTGLIGNLGKKRMKTFGVAFFKEY